MTNQPNVEDSLRALLEQARAYQRATDYDQAITLSSEILSSAQAIGDVRSITEARLVKGYSVFLRGNYALAATIALEALDDPETRPLTTLELLRLHQLIGVSFRQLGDLPTALDHYLQMTQLAEESGDRRQQARALHGIASIYNLMGDLSSAVNNCLQAIAILEDIGDQYGQAVVLTNLSSLYTTQENGQAAVETAQRARTLYQQIGLGENPHYETGALLSLAKAYFAQGEFDSAIRVLNETAAMAERYSLEMIRSELLLLRADIDNARGDKHAAISSYVEGLALMEAQKRSSFFYESHRKLSEAYQAIGDFQNALTAYQQFHQLKELLFNTDSDNRLKGLEIRFKTEAAQREADFYREQAAQIEAQRTQEATTFERINHLREEMLAAIRHDLKSPLTSIRMSIYLLKKNFTSDLRDRWLDNIDRQVTRMERFMSDVMDMVRLASGHTLDKHEYSAFSLLEIAVHGQSERASAKSIKVNLIPPDQPFRVKVNGDRMTRVLINVIDNAIVYSPPDTEITASVRYYTDANSNSVCYEIRDTGYGIASDDLPQVFDNFFRGQREEHANVEGTGLGLSLAKAIVEQHGGTITIESEVLRGTLVKIVIPAL